MTFTPVSPPAVSISPSETPFFDPVSGAPATAVRHLHRAMAGLVASRLISEVAEIGVPDALGDEPRRAADIAAEVGANPDALDRFMRNLAAQGIFDEVAPGCYAHNAASRLLREDQAGSLAGFARFQRQVIRRVAEHLGHTLRTGEPAFDQAFNASFYEHLAGHPEQEADWNATMAGRAAHLGVDLGEMLDWAGVDQVIDIGGNCGDLLIELIGAVPGITGTVFDQPHLADEAAKAIADAGLAGRLSFSGGDFFLRVPEGADRYLLANVLWNWPDDQAEIILSSIRSAMTQPGAKLVAVETVLPDAAGPHPAKALDVANLMLFGGRCRTLAEWDSLFAAAGLVRTSVCESDQGWSVITAEAR